MIGGGLVTFSPSTSTPRLVLIRLLLVYLEYLPQRPYVKITDSTVLKISPHMFDTISGQAKDLITSLLKASQEERISAGFRFGVK